MRLLLDTHVFLWWYLDAPELTPAARGLLEDPSNRIYVSAAVAWEISIKRALGRLEFEGSVSAAVTAEGFESLPISLAHADAITALPPLHADPFDRILVAQAKHDRLTLVTHDAAVRQYPDVPLIAV